MPRKAKEKIDENDKIIDEKKVVKKKTPAKKASSTKSSESPKASSKKSSVAKKSTTRKSALAKIIENIDISDSKSNDTSAKKKSTSAKKSTSSKKETTNSTKSSSNKIKKTTTSKSKTTATSTPKESTEKVSAKRQTTKKATTNKATTNKTPAKKTTTKTTVKKKSTKTDTQSNETPIQIAEYYDLPYKYGNTVVKLLAQTPNTLFVYWEVSDDDIDNFKKIYGDDFFNKSTPILIVHNLTLNKTYEVEINDFANCWYLNTEDSDCKYDIELGRRFDVNSYKNDGNIEADYLYVATSNDLSSPNDHILFEKIKEFVVFRNVNNDNVIKKNVKSLKFLKDIYKFYKEMYDEDVLNNPSSQFKF